MFQKAIQHSLRTPLWHGLRAPKLPGPLHLRLIRSFAVKVEVQDESSHSQSRRPKYKPVFVIDFQNDRFLVFRNSHKQFYFILGFLALVLGASTYQLFWNWTNGGKLRNFLSVWGFLIGLAGVGVLVFNSRTNIKSIHLLKGGTQIEIKPVLGWRRQTLNIRDIEVPSEMELQLMEMMQLMELNVDGKQFNINTGNPERYEMADRDLFMAIVKGSEVDTGLSSEHPTITL